MKDGRLGENKKSRVVAVQARTALFIVGEKRKEGSGLETSEKLPV